MKPFPNFEAMQLDINRQAVYGKILEVLFNMRKQLTKNKNRGACLGSDNYCIWCIERFFLLE